MPNYQRYAPRFKPYSLDEVEKEGNGIYPFTKPQGPIENTFINVLPHSQPYQMAHYGTAPGAPIYPNYPGSLGQAPPYAMPSPLLPAYADPSIYP